MKLTARRLLISILVFISLSIAAISWWAVTENTIFTGSYLRANNGTHIIIDRQSSPVVMRNRFASDAMFDGLEDGDRVLVVCDGINESYPAQSNVYFCFRLGKGEAADLPADTLHQLAELGWLSLSSL
ncbi:MAG: hypothetical protein VB071_06380 [Lawsonibacter sp.]|nr:hypothetical protein [Lawsonibacter sp.]